MIILALCVLICTVSGGYAFQNTFDKCPPMHDIWPPFDGVEPLIDMTCLNVSVPLNWDDISGPTINFMIRKVSLAGSPQASRQLWALQGGPGGDGAGLFSFAVQTLLLMPDVDVYLPDHRGTGYSNFLYCPEPWNLTTCAAYVNETYGDQVQYFTTTMAAMDVKIGIQLTSEYFGYAKTFVFGYSYGTYWTTRYMTVAPNQADAVVLDGNCAQDQCRFISYDIWNNEVGLDLLSLCSVNPTCMQYLGYDPIAAVSDLYEAIDSGSLPCMEYINITRQSLQTLLFPLLLDQADRVAVAPIYHRLLRCNEDDIKALTYSLFPKATAVLDDTVKLPLQPHTGIPFPHDKNGFSFVLMMIVASSEMYLFPNTSLPTAQEIQDQQERLFVASGVTPLIFEAYQLFPRYKPDQYESQYPTAFTNPVLLLNGNLDPQTHMKLAMQSAIHFQHPNQQLTIVPYSPHGTFCQSPVDNSLFDCGLQILTSWLDSDDYNADTSCIDHVIPIDFQGITEAAIQVSENIFGTPDLWN